MKFFEYLYYRMYSAYNKKNDDPHFRTFMYVSLVMFFFVIIILTYMDKILGIVIRFSKGSLYDALHSNVFLGAVIVFILLFTYLKFTQKDFTYYEGRYSKCSTLNKYIKEWMLVAFPVLFLFLSIFLLAPLFGGVFFGKEIKGIFGK